MKINRGDKPQRNKETGKWCDTGGLASKNSRFKRRSEVPDNRNTAIEGIKEITREGGGGTGGNRGQTSVDQLKSAVRGANTATERANGGRRKSMVGKTHGPRKC